MDYTRKKINMEPKLGDKSFLWWVFPFFERGLFEVPCSFWGVYSPSMNPNQLNRKNGKETVNQKRHTLLTGTVVKILEDYNPTTRDCFEQICTKIPIQWPFVRCVGCKISLGITKILFGSIKKNMIWEVILKETKHKCLKSSFGSAFNTNNSVGVLLGLARAFPLSQQINPTNTYVFFFIRCFNVFKICA